ncbi:hypothetical protein PIB30_039104 [Stylosanthes scabra]|uniref:PGG domain-containing protein n=1 Tax=Stylosanthes scabra TaxID=79078 RepID=A0ABU6ZCW9_9FABA|nr:hypothetical protein [Stylosanthes scabra]
MSQHSDTLLVELPDPESFSEGSFNYDTNVEDEQGPAESVIMKHGEHESQELVTKLYRLAKEGAATGLTQDSNSYSNMLRGFKSHGTKNTVLHIAALYGNDEMADHAVQQEPDIIFSINKNEDTPLHVAARAGHFSTIRTILGSYRVKSNNNSAKLLELMKMENRQGNTMLHEAMKSGSSSEGTIIFDALEAFTTTGGQGASVSLSQSCYELALDVTDGGTESVLCLAVEAARIESVRRILEKCPESAIPKGTSPLKVVMLKKNKGMGFLEGVMFLLGKCKTCSLERDNDGYFPLHLAARQGHVEVVKELLRYRPDVDEMLDSDLNNILHIAAESGKLDVVRYILQTPDELEKMIHQRNMNGDTPLHVASRKSHPSIVYALTCDDRVKPKVNELNSDNKTPLDVAFTDSDIPQTQNPSLRQASAEAPFLAELVESDIVSVATEQFKDRVESLSVISTLILTASVAACLSVPGEANGKANNLHKAMFHLFICSNTVSLFSSIGATIILIWGRFGMFELSNLSMEVALPLLGTALITLSLAFLAGIYTVVSKLTWLATTVVILTSTFVAIIFVLYVLLFLPSTSKRNISRCFSYYPFLYLASLAEKQRQPRFLSTIAGVKGPHASYMDLMYRGGMIGKCFGTIPRLT